MTGRTLKSLALAAISATVAIGASFYALPGCSSLFDRSPYSSTDAPGPTRRVAESAVATAPAVAAAANSVASAAFNPAVTLGTTAIGNIATSYYAELQSRLDSIDSRVAQLVANGTPPTKGAVEIETLVAMIASIGGALGVGRYHALASANTVAANKPGGAP